MPEDIHFYTRRRQNLKSRRVVTFYVCTTREGAYELCRQLTIIENSHIGDSSFDIQT
jgi:hypothetical protein